MRSGFSVFLPGLAVMLLVSCAPFCERPPLDYPPLPLVYEDAASHTLYYVETDRCHVAAVHAGKVLWVRDMCAVKGRDDENPGRIDSIGAIPNNISPGYVGIGFNSGDFGRFRKSDGAFVFEGCD
jgi:hypothetical protein